MTEPTARCTCHPVPEHLHMTHYGATEPGSALEPDPGWPVHFPATPWLEQVRADLTAATAPLVQPMDGVTRQQAVERLLGVHVPGLVAVVEGVQALFALRPDSPCRTTWRWGVECVEVPLDDLRKAIETARGEA